MSFTFCFVLLFKCHFFTFMWIFPCWLSLWLMVVAWVGLFNSSLLSTVLCIFIWSLSPHFISYLPHHDSEQCLLSLNTNLSCSMLQIIKSSFIHKLRMVSFFKPGKEEKTKLSQLICYQLSHQKQKLMCLDSIYIW